MLGWLTRLFGKRAQAESDAAPATAAPTDNSPSPSGTATPAIAESGPPSVAVGAEPVNAEPRETCPTCGKASVFAGPPGHRYCMHCALREELFDASAAARQ